MKKFYKLNFNKTAFLFLILFSLFFVKIEKLAASDFYWENPERITNSDSRFPKTINNSDSAAILWQEIDSKNHRIYLSAKIYFSEDSANFENLKDSINSSNSKNSSNLTNSISENLKSDGTVNSKHENHESRISWKNFYRFAGPFYYSGEVPDLYSAAINNDGKICVSVLSESNKISVFTLEKNSQNFIRSDFESQEFPVVAPRVYSLKSGDFMIFTSLGKDESFSLLSAKSSDGISWSKFEVLRATENFTNPFLPVLISSSDGELLFFQAQFNSGTRLSYQLFSTFSKNNGASWSTPELVTGPLSLLPGSNDAYTSFHNQRPSLLEKDGHYYVAWERNNVNSENSQIYFAEVDFTTGKILGNVEQITNRANASRPILFSYNNTVCITWFDTRYGAESSFFSQKNGHFWNEQRLSNAGQKSIFSFPIIFNANKNIAFVWQTNNSVYRLETDTTVKMPTVRPTTYTLGQRSKQEKVRYQITFPEDSSGIAGYSWTWSKDEAALPEENLQALPKERFINVEAKDEGEYFFSVRALDYAGNWSLPRIVSYFRDLTPPPAPTVTLPQIDQNGFLSSNSFKISWNFGEEKINDVAGYSYKLEKIENLEKRFASSKRHPLRLKSEIIEQKIQSLNEKYSQEKLSRFISAPSKKIMSRHADVNFSNYSNGVYIFAVRAFDQVGNVSEPTYAVLYLNKFEPFTSIYSIKKSTDIFGASNISLDGFGFNYDGFVSDIFIYKEGESKPAVSLSYANGDFKINSNTKITGIKLSSELEKGNYYIQLKHTDRGLYKSKKAILIDSNGTVKIEKIYEYKPELTTYTKIGKYNVQVSDILFVMIMILTGAGLIFALYGIISTVKDLKKVNSEIEAVLKGDLMPLQKEIQKNKHASELKIKGVGLKFKLILFTALLVISVVLPVSFILGEKMVKAQAKNLSEGLKSRVEVLLDSLVNGTKAYMPSENVLELSYLPRQKSALKEANYITITGFRANETNFENGTLDYVWASNDERVTGENDLIIDTDSFSAGRSKIVDENILSITKSCKELNVQATNLIGDLGVKNAKLYSEGAALALKNDKKSIERRDEIAEITTKLTTQMIDKLNDLSTENSSSLPVYSTETFDNYIREYFYYTINNFIHHQNFGKKDTEYLFYRPVLYRSGNSTSYVRAIVFMSVSTQSLYESLDEEFKTIMNTTALIAIVAILLGCFVAFIFASFIASPIRALAEHVQMIGDTDDKEELDGKNIKIHTKGEIGLLADMVNEMTRGLVEGAEAEKREKLTLKEKAEAEQREKEALEKTAKMLEERMIKEKIELDGKSVQQSFLPLDLVDRGGKKTTARLNDSNIEIFGYYEGADAVSGDYFDYKKLDSRYYAIIKCDVSGHGVPAALMMTVVAALFRKYFENWSLKTHGTTLDKLVGQINDFIESLGVRGKFATLFICLYDTKTGLVNACNAGDNIVHIFDSSSKKEKVITLHEAPAAGALPSFMVEMKGGFIMEQIQLKNNDIMYLYTDGIEEATRHFRDENFNIVKCAEPGLNEGDDHINHKVGQETELLEADRVQEILEAVLNKKSFKLEKCHNPVQEELIFDFSKLDGSIEDSILALVSVEKVFRLYKSPTMKGSVTKNDKGDFEIVGDCVKVDRKIDEFLKKTFNRYDFYCSESDDVGEQNYIYYKNVQADEQADDLTLLAIKRV